MRRAHTNGSYAQHQQPEVEEQNEHLVDGLKTKISALKSLSIDIGDEVRSQNKMLNEMDDGFDSTSGFLSTTMGRVMKLGKAGHNRYILYLMMFSMFVFFIIYVILRFQ